MSDAQRSALLATIRKAATKLTQATETAIAERTSVAPSPASSMPSTPRSVAESADFMTFAEPAQIRRQQQLAELPESLQQRSHFIDTWATKIEAFVYDNTRQVMEMPSDLHGFDRKTLHQLADHYNLSHYSTTVQGQRRLVLKKDELFYAKTVARPTDDKLAQLKDARPDQRRHHRHTDANDVPEKEQYADKSVLKIFKKFHKATDAYAKAVETGYQVSDEAAFVAPAPPEAPPAMAAHESAGWSAAFAGSQSIQSGAGMQAIIDAASRGDLYEVCTVCGNRLLVEYDPTRWECIGPCDGCGKDSVWQLETNAGTVMQAPTVPAAAAQAQAQATREKRSRPADDDESSATQAALTVSEVVELARLHNLSEADVKWVEAFATSRARNGAKDDHVLFCMDFADFDKYLPRLVAGNSRYYFKVVQPNTEVAATRLVNKLLVAVDKRGQVQSTAPEVDQTTEAAAPPAAAPAARVSCIKDVYVGFPGMEVTEGETLTLLVCVYVSSASLDETSARLAASDVNTEGGAADIATCGATVVEALGGA